MKKKKLFIIIILCILIILGIFFLVQRDVLNLSLKDKVKNLYNQEKRNDPVLPGHIDDSMKFVMEDQRYVVDETIPVTVPVGWIEYKGEGYSFYYPQEYDLQHDNNRMIIAPKFSPGENCTSKPSLEEFIQCQNPPRTPYIRIYQNSKAEGLSLPYEVAVGEKETIGAYAFNKGILPGGELGDETTYYAMYKDSDFYSFAYTSMDNKNQSVEDIQKKYGSELYTLPAEEQDVLLRKIIETFRIK